MSLIPAKHSDRLSSNTLTLQVRTLTGALGNGTPEAQVIPLAIEVARSKSRVSKSSGPTIRHEMAPAFETFIHVSDLAAAHSDSIDYPIGGGESIALNLGTGMAPA